jgi:cytochrome c oxidase subunit 3
MNNYNLKNNINKINTLHPYHIVKPSPWPIVTGFSALLTTAGAALFMHTSHFGKFLFFFGFSALVGCTVAWWKDVISEGTYEGEHTEFVQNGLRYGMVLFIVSEIMFFAAFFWAFFHSSLAPSMDVGFVWPPKGVKPFCPVGIPFLNTLILLSSGAFVTWSHHKIDKDYNQASAALFFTILLGVLFTLLQYYEYNHANFSMADSIYASLFFLLTGFHGFHVLVGTAFLSVCLIRMIKNQFRKHHYVGYEAAIWYWHFVDVVWLFLFISIYWWGGRPHA